MNKKKKRIKWSKEIIIDEIRRLCESGKKINSQYIQTNHQTLYGAANQKKYFGSWKKAVEAAGFDYNKIRVREETRRWSKQKVVEAILKRNKKGLPINGCAVSDQDRGLYKAAIRHFGKNGWKKSLRLAGFVPENLNPQKIWTKDSVILVIASLYYCDLPLYGYYLENNGFGGLVAGGEKCFGSWKNAIETAGLDYEKVRGHKWWTKEKIIAEIQNLNELGISLSSKFIQHYRGDLFSSGVVYFGSWSEAVEAAGINYQHHCEVWSSKAWLRKLNSKELDSIKQRAIKMAQKRRGNVK